MRLEVRGEEQVLGADLQARVGAGDGLFGDAFEGEVGVWMLGERC